MWALAKLLSEHVSSRTSDGAGYKDLLTEAIDAKAWGLRKARIYADTLLAPSAAWGPAAAARILAAPVRRFADPRVAWQLRTGYEDFPWGDVMERRARVDLGLWRPAGADVGKLALVRDALCTNDNMRAAAVCGHELTLAEGMRTRALDLRGSEAVRAAPETVAFVVSGLGLLESLDLRCAGAL